MAYFTRSRMVFMGVAMYEDNERFAHGATNRRKEDLEVLIGCQQKALVLGEYLESFGMDYTDIVEDIETYCNLIYDMAENLDNTEFIIECKYQVDRQLGIIINKIQDRIVEIANIEVFDFRNLGETKKENTLITKEINRLIDNCVESITETKDSLEYNIPIVVGSY